MVRGKGRPSQIREEAATSDRKHHKDHQDDGNELLRPHPGLGLWLPDRRRILVLRIPRIPITRIRLLVRLGGLSRPLI